MARQTTCCSIKASLLWRFIVDRLTRCVHKSGEPSLFSIALLSNTGRLVRSDFDGSSTYPFATVTHMILSPTKGIASTRLPTRPQNCIGRRRSIRADCFWCNSGPAVCVHIHIHRVVWSASTTAGHKLDFWWWRCLWSARATGGSGAEHWVWSVWSTSCSSKQHSDHRGWYIWLFWTTGPASAAAAANRCIRTACCTCYWHGTVW